MRLVRRSRLTYGNSLAICVLISSRKHFPPVQEAEEKRRQEVELARVLRDRGEGEEVPLATSDERSQRSRGQGVELRLHGGDEDSEDSDDDIGERMEGESGATSFQNFLQHQDHKRDTT